MDKNLRNLILMYLGFVLAKVILSYFIPSSRALADDYNYLKMSESFFYHFSLKVHGTFTGQFYPLYPIIISIAHIFKDNNLVYLAIKFINSILSSLIIFPAYYLSKEFLSGKKSLLTAIFISLLPANFALTSYIMAESLFYSLFLISIYFIYKAFKINNFKNYFLAILFSILTLATRVHGLILIFLIITLMISDILKKKLSLKYLLLIILIFILLLFWFFYFHNTIISLYFARYLSLIKLEFGLAFLIKYLSYFGFLLLSSGLILMLPFLISFKIKNNNLNLFRKIFLITLFISLFLATIHALGSQRYFYSLANITLVSGRIIGRYVDFILPSVVMLSIIGLEFYFNNKKKFNLKLKNFTVISTLIMLFTTSIILSPLVPLNNVSLTLFGALRYVIDILFYSNASFDFGTTLVSFILTSLIFVLLPSMNYYLLKKLKYRSFISLLLAFFIISSLISLSAVYYAAKTSWYYNSEQRQLALYLNKIDSKRSLVVIDERDEGDLGGLSYNKKALYGGTEESKYTILGYWLNDELIIGDINSSKANYIISTYELNLNKLYSTTNGIYLYKS